MVRRHALRNVELFASGVYRGKRYTPEDVDQIAENCRKLAEYIHPPAVIGHEEENKYGEPTAAPERTDVPADGWIDPTSVRAVTRRDRVTGRPQRVLVGDIVDVSPELAKELKNKRFRKVSAEIYDNFVDNAGKSHGKALRRVAFLGGEVPQVKGLADLPPLSFSERAFLPSDCLTLGDRLTFICFAEVVSMDREQMIQAIMEAMPGLNPATIEAMTDDQLADLAKNLPTINQTSAQPAEQMADLTREEMIQFLVENGLPEESLQELSDDEIKQVYDEMTGEQSQEPGAAPESVQFADEEDVDYEREELIDKLASMGEDRATLEAMSDEELRALYEAKRAESGQVESMSEITRKARRVSRVITNMTAQAVRHAAAMKRQDAEQFCERLIREGRILPSQKRDYLNILLRENSHQVRKYSELGRRVVRTPYEQKKAELLRRPVIIRFSERIKQTGPRSSEREVQAVQRFSEVHADALKKAGKTPAQYVEAFKKLRKANPEFTARDYGVPEEFCG